MKLGPRKGDNAEMALIELVTEPVQAKVKAAPTKVETVEPVKADEPETTEAEEAPAKDEAPAEEAPAEADAE